MARLTCLLLTSLALLNNLANAGSVVLDLIPDNFDNVILKSGKPGLVEFFAPWCGHCRNLAPIYEELAQAFEFASDKVSISKVDADEHKSLGKRFGVQGFPTLKWFDGKSDVPEDYQGARDLESLTSFITEKTGIRPKLKKVAPSQVEMLTDTTFETKIGGQQHALVAFTTPWCGHCKNLAPVWETLASDFALEPDVLIAKVNAEADNSKATAKAQGIVSYPTIKFFPKGSKDPENYEGGRTESDFIEFLNLKAGTHRVVGGGLDNKAGTIDSLDSIVARYVSGDSLAKITEEAKGVAQDLQQKYAPYYVKVLDKLGSNAGYAAKELARLEKLLGGGGLAAGKADDLMSRSNILRRFLGKEKGKDEL